MSHNFPEFFLRRLKKVETEKKRTKPGNLYYLVMFENRTKPGTVLSETVLSGDSPHF